MIDSQQQTMLVIQAARNLYLNNPGKELRRLTIIAPIQDIAFAENHVHEPTISLYLISLERKHKVIKRPERQINRSGSKGFQSQCGRYL